MDARRFTLLSPGRTVLPTRAKFTTSMELSIVWPPTWLECARVGSSWLEFDQAQIFAQLEPCFPPFGHLSQLKPTLAKLFCYYATMRSYSDNWIVSYKLARLSGIVWPPADASFDFLTWLELAWVGSTVWPGLYSSLTPASFWITKLYDKLAMEVCVVQWWNR